MRSSVLEGVQPQTFRESYLVIGTDSKSCCFGGGEVCCGRTGTTPPRETGRLQNASPSTSGFVGEKVLGAARRIPAVLVQGQCSSRRGREERHGFLALGGRFSQPFEVVLLGSRRKAKYTATLPRYSYLAKQEI